MGDAWGSRDFSPWVSWMNLLPASGRVAVRGQRLVVRDERLDVRERNVRCWYSRLEVGLLFEFTCFPLATRCSRQDAAQAIVETEACLPDSRLADTRHGPECG